MPLFEVSETWKCRKVWMVEAESEEQAEEALELMEEEDGSDYEAHDYWESSPELEVLEVEKPTVRTRVIRFSELGENAV